MSQQSSSPRLLEILRATLEQVEEVAESCADERALLDFKRSLLRAVADLQVKKSDDEPDESAA